MKLWIDAGRTSAGRDGAEHVFGMDLIERHLKAARHQKLELSEVIIDVGDGAAPVWASEPRLGCPVRVESGSGNCGDRLRRALAAGEVLLVSDAATLADARLYRYLADRTGSAAVRANKAAIGRVEPADAEKILSAPTLDAAIGHLAEVSQDEFPSFVVKLRRALPFYLFSVTNPAERKSVEPL